MLNICNLVKTIEAKENKELKKSIFNIENEFITNQAFIEVNLIAKKSNKKDELDVISDNNPTSNPNN